MHSERLLKRFRDPAWAGDLESPTVVVIEGNPTCGDVVQIALQIQGGLVAAAKFRTLGCAVAIAASDAVCELVVGETLAGAEVLDLEEISATLDGIPPERESCVMAALSALRGALGKVRRAEVSTALLT